MSNRLSLSSSTNFQLHAPASGRARYFIEMVLLDFNTITSADIWAIKFSLAGTLVPHSLMMVNILQRAIIKLDDASALTACSLVLRVFLPRGHHHLFRHVTFYPGDGRCVQFFADKASLVEELTIFERRLPGDKGIRTDAWTEALRRVLTLLVSLWKSSGVRSGVQGMLAPLTSVTLDGVFFSSLAELGAFFGCVPHLRRLAVNVITIGRGDDDAYEGVLCKELETLKVGIGQLRTRWMRFLFGRNSIISLENLRELIFPVTSEVDSWMPGVHELFGRAPRLESAMLLDWRGSHQNPDHITPVPDISHLRFLAVFIPLAYTDRY
ncbi:hypothetical protein ARMSODRAFT_982111 [Armillaria solidipes]|uniref:Uncharacterized protein n=1 Tax=Armillaria solidipes TaxID=1076256 RepID=A0A2H3APK3_9AGAR|nr:hypothetical protein ARMSODRAFT_982111 [Armillaria solidipes]